MIPISEDGVFLSARASSPCTETGRSALARRGLARRSLYPLEWGQRECRLGPPAHQARASGLTHPHVVRLADPDYPRCAVFVRPAAHKPRFPHLLNSRCEISSRRRYAAASELRALGRTSTVSHPAKARLGHRANAGVVGLFEPDACAP